MNEVQRYLVEEFADEYMARRIDRRTLLRRTLLVTGSVPVTASALVALGCGDDDGDNGGSSPASTATSGPEGTLTASPAAGATQAGGVSAPPPAATTTGVTVQPNDPAIQAEEVRFRNGSVELLGYLARPRAAGQDGAVLVIHENQGLLEHFKDVARRYAKEGFAALALDLVSRGGGTKADQRDQNTGFLGRANREEMVSDMQSALDYLKGQEYVKTGALGAIGFCLGGMFVWELAAATPDLKAAAPFYGSARLETLGNVQAAVMAVYGSEDRITSQAAQVEEALKASGRPYAVKTYQGANHAFFNDSGGRYHPEAARQAWSDTLAWFRQHMT